MVTGGYEGKKNNQPQPADEDVEHEGEFSWESKNKANQMNPNNPLYWTNRGHSDRPQDYQRVIDNAKRDGQLINHANSLGHLTSEQRALMGQDIRDIERAAKRVFGGD